MEHWQDLLVILLVGLLVFGPKRLPELGSSLGKTLQAFRQSMHDTLEPPAEAPPSPPAEPATPVTPVEERTDHPVQ